MLLTLQLNTFRQLLYIFKVHESILTININSFRGKLGAGNTCSLISNLRIFRCRPQTLRDPHFRNSW